MKLERAVIRTEVRAAGDPDELRVAGLGVVYDTWEEIWPGYRERILRGAVELAPEIKSYFNHDPNMVLSTTASNPPLVLRETDEGYEYDSPIPPTSYGRDLIVNLERRNVKGSSFTFVVPRGGDSWWEDDNGVVHREIRRLILYEIGPVTDPAFVSTTAAIRSSREALLQERRAALVEPEKPLRIPDPEDVRRLVRHGELRATL